MKVFFDLLAALMVVMLLSAVATPAYASCDPRVEQHTVDNPDQFKGPPPQSLSPTTGGEEPVTVYYDSVTNQRCNP